MVDHVLLLPPVEPRELLTVHLLGISIIKLHRVLLQNFVSVNIFRSNKFLNLNTYSAVQRGGSKHIMDKIYKSHEIICADLYKKKII